MNTYSVGRGLRVAIWIVLCCAFGLLSCSSQSADNAAKKTTTFNGGQWALHIQVGPDRKVVDFSPDATLTSTSSTEPTPSAQSAQGLRLQTLPNEVLETVPARALLFGAATLCE